MTCFRQWRKTSSRCWDEMGSQNFSWFLWVTGNYNPQHRKNALTLKPKTRRPRFAMTMPADQRRVRGFGFHFWVSVLARSLSYSQVYSMRARIWSPANHVYIYIYLHLIAIQILGHSLLTHELFHESLGPIWWRPDFLDRSYSKDSNALDCVLSWTHGIFQSHFFFQSKLQNHKPLGWFFQCTHSRPVLSPWSTTSWTTLRGGMTRGKISLFGILWSWIFEAHVALVRYGLWKTVCSLWRHMGLSENSVPLHPMVNDHYPY